MGKPLDVTREAKRAVDKLMRERTFVKLTLVEVEQAFAQHGRRLLRLAAGIAHQHGLQERASGLRALGAGRKLVAECRQAGAEAADQIEATLTALARPPRRTGK